MSPAVVNSPWRDRLERWKKGASSTSVEYEQQPLEIMGQDNAIVEQAASLDQSMNKHRDNPDAIEAFGEVLEDLVQLRTVVKRQIDTLERANNGNVNPLIKEGYALLEQLDTDLRQVTGIENIASADIDTKSTVVDQIKRQVGDNAEEAAPTPFRSM